MQLLLDAVISGDITSIEGAAIKLFLGIVSCAFDLFFMFQHYYLYPASKGGNLIVAHEEEGKDPESNFVSENINDTVNAEIRQSIQDQESEESESTPRAPKDDIGD